MEYKVGDKVRVILNPKPGRTYYMKNQSGQDSMTEEMRALAGKVVTITSANKSGYEIQEDNWHWVDEMFSGLVVDSPETIYEPEPIPKPESGPKYKVGDKVRVRSDLSDSFPYKDEKGRIHCGCVEPMLKHAGKVVTIKTVINRPGAIYYNIKEGGWNWVYEEFDGLATEEPAPAPAPELHTDWSWEDLF